MAVAIRKGGEGEKGVDDSATHGAQVRLIAAAAAAEVGSVRGEWERGQCKGKK